MRNNLLGFLVLSLILVVTSSAQAITLSGDVEQIAPPANAQFGQLESNNFARFWVEQFGVVLTDPLSVDVIPFLNNPSGVYDSGIAAVEATWSGVLSTDHVYASYFLHADKDGDPQTFAGSITFDFPIAGIIYRQPRLNNTDPILGAPGTLYADGPARLFELDGANNYFIISADLKTLTFQTQVFHNLDDMRIITHTPEPTTVTLLGLGLAGLLARRRRTRG